MTGGSGCLWGLVCLHPCPYQGTDLNPRQHLIAEFFHFLDRLVGVAPLEVEIHCGDAKVAEGGNVLDDMRDRAGEQLPMAVRAERRGVAVAFDTVGNADLR